MYRLHRLPHIGDNIHIQIGGKYYTKLDLGSGYWQVEMEEKDKAKTAFGVCNFGFYECNHMFVGLTNAPATFQCLMECFMGAIIL